MNIIFSSVYWKPRVHLCSPRMGCTRSSFEPLICQRDEQEYLRRNRCGNADNRVISSQSSNDWSVLKVEGQEVSNLGAGASSSCPPVHWYGDIPSILGLILLMAFLITIYRRWQGKQRAKQMRRTMAQSMALQTVSASVPCAPETQWRGVGNRFLS